MAMGTRKGRERQQELWVATATLARPAGHPFYERLNVLLDKCSFDEFVEDVCRRFYAENMGRPGLSPGMYFRLLLLGYFEGIDSERGIAWRAADSLSIRAFLRVGLEETAPDQTTISRTRRLIDVETHQLVFAWVLTVLAEHGLLRGKTIGIDATTLEANAALRSIVRRDTGQTYQEFLLQLAEHAVDMETGAVVAVTVQPADAGDTQTVQETLERASEHIGIVAEAVNPAVEAEMVNANGPVEVVTDKGYHSREVVRKIGEAGIRTYISEPNRGAQSWIDQSAEQRAVYGNRRRVKGERGAKLQRQRGERLERINAHLYETGGMRRVHLRGRDNILKRLLIHICGLNLGLLMRWACGLGTPRGLQGRRNSPVDAFQQLLHCIICLMICDDSRQESFPVTSTPQASPDHQLAACFHSSFVFLIM